MIAIPIANTGASLAAIVAIILVVVAASPPAGAAPPVHLSGAYVGGANVSALRNFAIWRGANTPVALDYLDNQRWSDLSDSDWLLGGWQTYVADGGTLVLSVPLLTDEGGTLAAVAHGTYDRYFRQLAKRLVAHKERAAIVRLGWEFNGSWFPWGVHPHSSKSGTKAFIAAWRHVVRLMRSVRSAHFKFDWTVNLGWSTFPAEAAYPGNRFVDYVGVDTYDQGWGPGNGPIPHPAARWRKIRYEKHGLDWWLAFARSHGKRITLPEWGLVSTTTGHGGGDDPLYIRNMHAWMAKFKPAYECYFNAGTSLITTGAYPSAARAYIALWSKHNP